MQGVKLCHPEPRYVLKRPTSDGQIKNVQLALSNHNEFVTVYLPQMISKRKVFGNFLTSLIDTGRYRMCLLALVLFYQIMFYSCTKPLIYTILVSIYTLDIRINC